MAAEGPAVSSFQVGQRVCTSDEPHFTGSVRYIGEVEGQSGDWVGVEWDNPSRGRHSGEAGGRAYFCCKVAGSGSFVRPYKIDGGVTLTDALVQRYRPRAPGPPAGEEQMYIMSARHRRMLVELVGKEKVELRQGDLAALRSACLESAGVCGAGPPGALQSMAGNIEELDLSGNLLEDWQTVVRIKEELRVLRFLNLSNSRIRVPPPPLPPLAGLVAVVLNSCALTWAQVHAIQASLPDLQELHLCSNQITALQAPCEGDEGRGFASLRVLSLEDNLINDWAEVRRLAWLPRLEALYLSGNTIARVEYDAEERGAGQAAEPRVPFHCLKRLLFGRNRLSDWSSIDALGRFPQLQDMRLTENPICSSPAAASSAAGGARGASGEGAARHLFIARMPRIATLNGSEITASERKEAEIRYVRQVMADMAACPEEEIAAKHPGFLRLRATYGITADTVVPVVSSREGGRPGSSFLAVRLLHAGNGEGGGLIATLSKKLPLSTQVGKLKLICERLFGVPLRRQVLHVADEETPQPYLMSKDSDTLGDCRLGANPAIIVQEGHGKDAEAARSAALLAYQSGGPSGQS